MSDPMRFETDQIPADLRDIDQGLARLAEVDRAAAPAAMESRVLARVRAARAERARSQSDEPAIAWFVRVFTPMRVAAALALVGALVAVRMASLRGPDDVAAPTSEAVEADAMLIAWSTAQDERLDSIGQEIDLFMADLVSFDASLSVGDGADPEGGSM